MSERDITEVQDMIHRTQRRGDSNGAGAQVTVVRLVCDRCGAVSEGTLPEEGSGAGKALLDHILAQPERAANERREYLCQACTL